MLVLLLVLLSFLLSELFVGTLVCRRCPYLSSSLAVLTTALEQAYIVGAWSPARYYFRKVLAIQPDDGPTLALLQYMQEFDAPLDWKGYRGIALK